MRRLPAHPYLCRSAMDREYMAGFKRGRDRRAWLDSCGKKRVEQIINKSVRGGWHWELQVEKQIHAQGWAKSEKLASQQCEDAAVDRLDTRHGPNCA